MILKYLNLKYSFINKSFSSLYIFPMLHKAFNINIFYSYKYLYNNTELKFCSSLSYKEEKSVQKTDPIIAKYRKLLDNIPKNTENEVKEFIYGTDFGHVRFDSDAGLCVVNDDNLKEDKDCNYNIEKLDSENLNYIDEIYFKDTFSNISHLNSEAVPLTRCVKKDAYEELSAPDLSYIDSQYVGRNSQNTQETVVDISVSKIDSDLNHIDSQYFGQTDPTEELILKPEESSFSSSHTNYTKKEKSTLESSSENSETYTTDMNESELINKNIYSFENSLLEDSDEVCVEFNPDKINERKELSRDALESELIELANKESQNLLNNNIKLLNKRKPETKNENTETEHSVSTDEVSYHKIDENNKEEDPMAVAKKIKAVESAYDFVRQKRKEELKSNIKSLSSEILPHEKYKKVLLNVPRYSDITQYELVTSLKKAILYNKNDIVAISKPYGIQMHNGGGTLQKHRWDIVGLLPLLADEIKEDKLLPVHRLDMNTTGVLLFAKTEEMSAKLKKMFKDNAIKKTYLAIAKGIPNPSNGIIDIPIGQGKVDKYERMVLYPAIPGSKARNRHTKKAMTRYKVLSQASSCSLLELNPITGIKHQLRVHLGFGIGCPVLGDHKYSYLTKMAPQKLPGDALEMFGMKQSAVRHLPLHLHSFSISIPGLAQNAGEVFVRVGPPKFFKQSLKILKLSNRYNRNTTDYSDIIYGYT